jgi:hypothetical protein
MSTLKRTAIDDVHFSPQQLEYLERIYPQTVLPATATEAACHRYFGTQAVLQTVREKTRGITGQTLPTR